MIEMWAPWTNFPARNDSLGIRIGCPPCILSKHWYNPSSFTFTLSCFWFILNVSVSLYCSWTFLKMSFLCFNSSLAVNGSFNLCFLKLLRKQPIQLNTPNVLRSENFDNSLSKMFSVADVVAKTFYNYSVFGCSGRCVWSWRHLGPSHHLLSKLTYFTTSAPKVGRIFFCMNIFPFDKIYSFDFRHPVTNKYFIFPVIF